MFNLSNKEKLEKQLMAELKELAGVEDFPWEDAQVLSKLLAAYDRGDTTLVMLAVTGSESTLEKYPKLYDNWDDLMIKYHKLGLFPNWNIHIDTDDESVEQSGASEKLQSPEEECVNSTTIHSDDEEEDEDDEEYVDILAKHMVAEKLAVEKSKSLKKLLSFVSVLLIAALCFGGYEFYQLRALKEESDSKVEDAENKTEEVINTASELLDQYSSEFAYASDPIGKTYHKYSCPKLTDHYYYDTVNNWKNRGLKKCKLCYAAGWDMYLAVSLADGE